MILTIHFMSCDESDQSWRDTVIHHLDNAWQHIIIDDCILKHSMIKGSIKKIDSLACNFLYSFSEFCHIYIYFFTSPEETRWSWRWGTRWWSAWSRTRWCAASPGRRGSRRRSRAPRGCRGRSPWSYPEPWGHRGTRRSSRSSQSPRAPSRWCSRWWRTEARTGRSWRWTWGRSSSSWSLARWCTGRRSTVAASWRCSCMWRWCFLPSWQPSFVCSSASSRSLRRGSHQKSYFFVCWSSLSAPSWGCHNWTAPRPSWVSLVYLTWTRGSTPPPDFVLFVCCCTEQPEHVNTPSTNWSRYRFISTRALFSITDTVRQLVCSSGIGLWDAADAWAGWCYRCDSPTPTDHYGEFTTTSSEERT